MTHRKNNIKDWEFNITTKPNIIFIMADDMGYGDLGCYGAEKIPTPNMDSIAENGVKFTDAHSSSAVCPPSRYSVMAGRYCWRTWLKKWVLGGFGAPLIEPGRETTNLYLEKPEIVKELSLKLRA